MKINNLTPLNPLPKPEQGKSISKDGAAAAEGSGSKPSAVVTHLHQAARDSSQDIDTARVNEIREAIKEGRLEINSEKIADSLIDSVRNMLEQE